MTIVVQLEPRTRRGTLNGAKWEVKYSKHTGKHTWCVEIPRAPLRMADFADDAATAEANALAAIRAYQKNGA